MDAEVVHRFRNYLQGKNLKVTTERIKILEEVFNNHTHFDADTIFLDLNRRGVRVSRATIYRTLELLVRSGLVQKVRFGENLARYEHTYGHERHDHLICTQCGHVEEISDMELEQQIQHIASQRMFRIRDRSIQIFGLCPVCQKNLEPRKTQTDNQ